MLFRSATTMTMTLPGEAVQTSENAKIPDMKGLREAIPARCFERSLLRSMSYVVRDLVAVSILGYAGLQLIQVQSMWSIPLWALYGFVQGLFFVGLWILAHECGHDSFSSHLKTNATIGFVLHSMLLAPFFSWKYSHARHHRYHNHMEKDTVFVPNRAPNKKASLLERMIDHTAADTPIVTLCSLVVHQLFGWPAYILINAGAGAKSLVKSNRKATSTYKQSHLDPTSNVFTAGEQPFVLLSNIGILAVFFCLYLVSSQIGFVNTFLLYGVPYLWMNHWIVAITYLHHTHPDAPHYEEGSWTFQLGSLSTIDREMGWIGRHIFHGIVEYHVIHHMFPRIPFYHAEEATWAVAPLLGNKYLQQKTSFYGDLWQAFTMCKYVKAADKKEPGKLHWTR